MTLIIDLRFRSIVFLLLDYSPVSNNNVYEFARNNIMTVEFDFFSSKPANLSLMLEIKIFHTICF